MHLPERESCWEKHFLYIRIVKIYRVVVTHFPSIRRNQHDGHFLRFIQQTGTLLRFPPIRSGFSSLLSENEWEAALSPSLELRWDVSHSTAMLLNGGWTKVLSNSGYRRESNLTLSAQAILTLP